MNTKKAEGAGETAPPTAEPTMEQLRQDAVDARAQADAAAKDATRLQFIAQSLSDEAQGRVDEANRAAAEAEQSRLRMEAELAAKTAELESAKAALADTNARVANEAAAAAREAAETAKRQAEKLADGTKPAGGPSVRLEGGGFALVDSATGLRDYRVLGLDGTYYEHVGQHPSGEWTYRNQDV